MKQTQEQTIIKLLKSQDWVSTVDAVNVYILRLGAIIFTLKKKGYVIESRKVQGKSYQEYRLVSKPKSWENVVNELSPNQVPKAPAQLPHRPEYQRANMPLRENSGEKVGQRNGSGEKIQEQDLRLQRLPL